jgi:hypothetical protein
MASVFNERVSTAMEASMEEFGNVSYEETKM